MPQDLVLTAEKALDLEGDVALLKAIADTLAHAGPLLARLGGALTIEDVLETIGSGAPSPAVAAAFEAEGLGDDYKVLEPSLSKLINPVTHKLPPQCQALLKPLSAFAIGDPNGIVSWTIATTGNPLTKASTYNLNLGANAALTFTAGAKRADDAPPKKLLSFDASGKADADANATLPIPYGTVKAGAQIAAELDLTYFFSPPDTELFVLAVAERLGDLPDPFDFDSVWESVTNPTSDLAGVTYTFTGGANVQVQVALADAAALGAGVTADLGAAIGVSVGLTTTYTLSLARVAGATGAFAMQAKLSRNPVTSTDFTASVGLDVDLSSLTAPILKSIDTALGDWNAILAGIRPFLQPGTWLQTNALAWLQTELGAIVQDAGLMAALITDLKGALGAEAVTDSALVDWLRNQVTGAIGRGQVLLDGDVNAAAQRVVALLTTAAPTLAQAAGAQLNALVSEGIGKLNAALVGEVDKLIAQPAADVEAALKAAGADIQGAVSTLDSALSSVRDLLSKVDAKFQATITAVEAALKSKVTAKIYLEDVTSSGVIIEVDGVFTAAGDTSRAVFDALTLGRLQTLVSLIDGEMPSAGFALDQKNSSITRFSKTSSQTGIDIVFLNIEMKGVQVIDVDATSAVDGFGNVHVNSKAAIDEILSTPLNTHEVSFVETYALVLAAAMQKVPGAGIPVLQLGLSASFASNGIGWGDIEDFLQGLEKAGLVSAIALPAAQAAFDAWSHAAGADKLPGSLSASLNLAGPQIAALLQPASLDPSGQFPHGVQRAIIDAGINALVQTGALSRPQFDAGISVALAASDHAPMAEADAVLDYYPTLIGTIYGPSDEPPTDDNTNPELESEDDVESLRFFCENAYAIRCLVDLIQTMSSVYKSTPASTGAAGGLTNDAYSKAQDTIAHDSGYWLTPVADLVGFFSPNVAPKTLAFMRAVADLSGMAGKAAVVVTLTYKPAAGQAQTAAVG